MLPQFDISFYPSQIFWFLVSFGLTYVVVKKFIEPRYIKIIGSRDEGLSADFKEIEQMQEQIEDLKNQYDRLQAALEIKKQKSFTDSLSEFDSFASQAMQKLEGDLAKKVRIASKTLDAQRKALEIEQAKAVISAVNAIIKNIAGSSASDDVLRGLYKKLRKE